MTLQCRRVLLLRKGLACLFTMLLCLTGSVPLSSLPVLAQGLISGDQPKPLTNEQKRDQQIDLTVNEAGADREPTGTDKANSENPPLPQAPLSKLDYKRLEQIAARLPKLESSTEAEFKLATTGPVKPLANNSLPLPDLTVNQPNKVKQAATSIGPLKITRVSDQGKVSTVSQLAVSFSQPMIELKAAALAQPDQYLSITPKPDGTYQWLNNKTLAFTPSRGRLPRATPYIVKIPTTTQSIYGKHLDKPYVFSIDTPPVTATSMICGQDGPRSLTPLIVVSFDQGIDRQSIIKLLSMAQASNAKDKLAVQIVPDSTVIKDKTLGPIFSKIPNDQWLAFEPLKTLAKDTKYLVNFASSLPSKEGPLKSIQSKTFSLKTYGNLKIISGPEANSSPESWNSHVINFSNFIDKNSFDPKMVNIQPAIAGVEIKQQDSSIIITGELKALTTYTVTIDKNLGDIYGQKLGNKLTLRFKTGKLSARLDNNGKLITLPTFASPVYRMQAQGLPQVKLTLRKVQPNYWIEYANLLEKNQIAKIKGLIVETRTINVGQTKKTIEINLDKYLTRGYGHFIATAESLGTKPDQACRTISWLQVTNLGTDIASGNTINVLVTNLANGKFVPGAKVQLLPTGTIALTSLSGLATMPAPPAQSNNQVMLVAKGDDTALTPNTSYQKWVTQAMPPVLHWYVVTDRNLYKPGETVTCKGYLRLTTIGAVEQIEHKLPNVPKLAYTIKDPTGIEIGNGECMVNKAGAFNFAVKVPEKINLGRATIEIMALPSADSHKNQFKKPRVSGFEEISQIPIKTEDGKTIVPYSTMSMTSFLIQQFRAPEFEMKVSSNSGNVLQLGQKTNLLATTKYFAGGTLTEAPISWQIDATPATYSPTGWSDYKFGLNESFWSREYRIEDPPRTIKTLTSHTGADGQSAICVKVDKASEDQPTSINCKAEVMDLNRQSWSDTATILVHPSDYYVGLQAGSNFYHSDKPLDFKMIVTDKNGKAHAGSPVNLKLMLTQSDLPDKLVDEQTVQSGAAPISINYKPVPGGEYKLIATVSDSNGHKQRTAINTWIQGKEQETFTTIQSQSVEVLPSKSDYQPGDKAEVVVFSPFFPAQGTLTVRRASIVQSMPLSIESSATAVEIPVTSDFISDFNVHVQLSGKNGIYGDGNATIQVKPLEHKLTIETITPQVEYTPGADTVIDVTLKDAQGQAVANGEVAIAVVDESILALTGYRWTDPLDSFYPNINSGPSDVHNRETVVLPKLSNIVLQNKSEEERKRYYDKNPWAARGLGASIVDPRYGQSNDLGGGDAMAALPPPSALPPPPLPESKDRFLFAPNTFADSTAAIGMRNKLSSLALFEPGLLTDQSGKASVKLHLPDNLTRYRIMAIAASGNSQFGVSESNITARLPLSIKPSAPRFLNFGDRCELPLMVYNQSDAALKTEVVLQASNASLKDANDTAPVYANNGLETVGQMQVIAPHDRLEVRFALATKDIGKIRLQCAVLADDKNDATYIEIPVQVPATTESTAVYGEIDSTAKEQVVSQPLKIFADTYDQVGGLSVTTSSTAMQNLLDSYIYLRDYQFNCSEQLSSRIIATLSLQNVLSAFGKLDSKDNALISQQIQKDVDQLSGRQRDNGGFGLWSKDDRDKWPYVTLQTIEALNLAKNQKYKVNPDKLSLANALLKDFNSEIPGNYTVKSRLALQARALSLRSQLKDSDPRAARLLMDSALSRANTKGQSTTRLSALSIDQVRAALPLECAAWLLDALGEDKDSAVEAELLRRYINSAIVETASTASVKSTGYGEYDYCMFYSNSRAEAVIMQSLIKDRSDNPLIGKLAKGLLNSRKRGLWNGPQENHVIIKALQKYFATYEKDSPDMIARLWLNDNFAAEQLYKGRSAESKAVTVPLSYLKQNGVKDLTLSKSGAGRLYYRFGLDYAPRQTILKPADFGFAVERTYEGVKNIDDAKKDQDGVWHFKSGSAIRSKVRFVANGNRYHVALIDPLPAGAEAINSELSGSAVVVPTQIQEEKHPILDDNQDQSESRSDKRLPAPPPASAPASTIDQPWWEWPWFEHQNLRDQQAEAFASELYAGDYSYSYLMRATTPGEYNVPPTKVLEMYETETFGRAASERVIVE